ncbi:hypothetical protein PISMIDRAFT_346268 [Pisolithus microcarpus 441]|uniref:Uncharacterized protein n=1 Tax=Pisolithus microcarpus 441 TaxID=765257 RepID=A0A0C9Z3P6_9AGAM|nr:hypothetical protein PISMIDRAFT_346268 [Pisolithus microcarpus 441]
MHMYTTARRMQRWITINPSAMAKKKTACGLSPISSKDERRGQRNSRKDDLNSPILRYVKVELGVPSAPSHD